MLTDLPAQSSVAAGIGIHFADAGVECTTVTEEELAEHIPAEMRGHLLTEEEVRELGGE